MEVTIFGDSSPPQTFQRRGSDSRRSIIILGLVGTTVLHAILFQLLFLGTARQYHPSPNPQERREGFASTSGSSRIQLVIVRPTVAAEINRRVSVELLPIRIAAVAIPSILDSIEPPSSIDDSKDARQDETESVAETRYDDSDEDRYARLVQERIEKVWKVPPTLTNNSILGLNNRDEVISCQARIDLGRAGNIQTIALSACDASANWRKSLVLAIEQSFPLPSPPNTSFMSNQITLSFKRNTNN